MGFGRALDLAAAWEAVRFGAETFSGVFSLLRVTLFVANAVIDYSTALPQHQVSSSGSTCLQILKT